LIRIMHASRKPAEPEPFPPAEHANEDGLLAIGGDLSVERLLMAYRNGIFPWFEDGLPVLWWSPNPRAILEPDALHVSRRLRRTIRQEKFRITIDHCFEDVMRGCGNRAEGTWITQSMLEAYGRLHGLGLAHSVEAWIGDELAGGVYGVSIGGFFAAESMFFRQRDASKVALVALVERLRDRGFSLLDVQILNDHTATLGATEIARPAYLQRLASALSLPVRFSDPGERPV
jgi:leucyl/phenylalanyl-tRNA--protein transferase